MENTTQPPVTPVAAPAKYNVYDKATDRKLTNTPLAEAQVEDFKRRLTESNGGKEVIVKQVLLG